MRQEVVTKKQNTEYNNNSKNSNDEFSRKKHLKNRNKDL